MIGLLLRSPWAWGALGALLLASHAGVAVWVQTEVNEAWEGRMAASQAAQEKALRIEQAKQKEIGDRWQGIVDRVRGERDALLATIEQRDAALAQANRKLAAAVGESGWMRQRLAEFAGRAGPDPGAAGVAGTLAAVATEGAELLAEGAELLRACARDHDTRAAEVSALVEGWPRVTGPGDDG